MLIKSMGNKGSNTDKGAVVVKDVFCGAGGASMGFSRVGIKNIVGYDKEIQPEYPFTFIKADVRELIPEDFDDAILLWASPPCQKFTWASKKHQNNGKSYDDFIDFTRKLFLKTGIPFVIENVCTAPIKKDLMLTGDMFGLRCIKARAFEIHGFKVRQPFAQKRIGTVKENEYVTVAGHGGDGKSARRLWQIAMGTPWIEDKHMLAEAIPPAYSEYIMREFLWQM